MVPPRGWHFWFSFYYFFEMSRQLWIAMTFGTSIHVPFRKNSDNFGDPLTSVQKRMRATCEKIIWGKSICVTQSQSLIRLNKYTVPAGCAQCGEGSFWECTVGRHYSNFLCPARKTLLGEAPPPEYEPCFPEFLPPVTASGNERSVHRDKPLGSKKRG